MTPKQPVPQLTDEEIRAIKLKHGLEVMLELVPATIKRLVAALLLEILPYDQVLTDPSHMGHHNDKLGKFEQRRADKIKELHELCEDSGMPPWLIDGLVDELRIYSNAGLPLYEYLERVAHKPNFQSEDRCGEPACTDTCEAVTPVRLAS